jgi:hypothetical protein
VIEPALRHQLPSIWEAAIFVRDGGLLSYGPSFPDMYRRSARYVARILKGANPAELPVEQPTLFEMFVNQKTAKALSPSNIIQSRLDSARHLAMPADVLPELLSFRPHVSEVAGPRCAGADGSQLEGRQTQELRDPEVICSEGLWRRPCGEPCLAHRCR